MARLEDILTPPKIGVFGGTFNPIHTGHLLCAEIAADVLELQRVLFMVAACSPFKDTSHQASTEDRLRMCRLACNDNPKFEVSSLECKRPAPSYTIDSLKLLHERYGARADLFFILGSDAALTLDSWHKPTELAEQATFVVMGRPGFQAEQERRLKELHESFGFAFIPLIMPELSLSSTSIRAQVCEGRSVRYQTPCAVEHFILSHKLYGAKG